MPTFKSKASFDFAKLKRRPTPKESDSI